MNQKYYHRIFTVQGVYYVLTGLWPVIDIQSFMYVTGYKTDQWLVNMVGVLALATGTGLLHARWRKEYDRSLVLIAFLTSTAFAAIDVYYSAEGRISLIYLGDAFVQVIFIICNFKRLRVRKE